MRAVLNSGRWTLITEVRLDAGVNNGIFVRDVQSSETLYMRTDTSGVVTLFLPTGKYEVIARSGRTKLLSGLQEQERTSLTVDTGEPSFTPPTMALQVQVMGIQRLDVHVKESGVQEC